MKDEKGNWRLPVEPAKPGAAPVRKVMWTPGPVDLKAYEASHAEVKKP